MMYPREAPKPVWEPGLILPLIGCGCISGSPVFNSGRSEPRFHKLKKALLKVWGLGVGITMSYYSIRDHLVGFTFL